MYYCLDEGLQAADMTTWDGRVALNQPGQLALRLSDPATPSSEAKQHRPALFDRNARTS
jgi:hypothetical protein